MTVEGDDHVMLATQTPWAVLPTLLGISKAMNNVWYSVPDDTKGTVSLIYTVALSLEILVGAKKKKKKTHTQLYLYVKWSLV